jgi:hypothetical protein
VRREILRLRVISESLIRADLVTIALKKMKMVVSRSYNSSLFDEFVCKLGLFWDAWAILKRE